MCQSATRKKDDSAWTDVLTEEKLQELLRLWELRRGTAKTEDYRKHCIRQTKMYTLRLQRQGCSV